MRREASFVLFKELLSETRPPERNERRAIRGKSEPVRRRIALFLAVLLALLIGSLLAFRGAAHVRESRDATADAPANGAFVEAGDARLHVSRWGPAEGPVLAFTHGMAAWGGLWEATAELLARRGYRVLAVDLPPFGFSERVANVTRTAQAKRLGELIQAMSLDRPLLVGHSYGGGIAAELMLSRPELARGVVLVSPVLALDAEPTPKSVPFPLRYDVLVEPLVSMTVTNPWLTRTLVRRFMHREDALRDEHVEILQPPGRRAGSTAAMVEWLRTFVSGDVAALSRDAEAYRKAKVPFALIWGEEDTVTPIGQGENLARLRDPVSFARLTGVGHMPQIEDPEGFQAALLDAVRDLASETSGAVTR